MAEEVLKGRLERGIEVSSDEAVELLVEGRIGAAFLGGIQASYVNRRFREAMLVLTVVPQKTRVHLWFNGSTYGSRDYTQLVPALLEAWRATCQIWKDISEPTEASDRLLRRWVESLASDINLAAQQAAPRIPIDGWAELASLHDAHDTLESPDRVRPYGEKVVGAKRGRVAKPLEVMRDIKISAAESVLGKEAEPLNERPLGATLQ